MVIIGLTGGIASGKSTVAAMLEEKGAFILDADQVARDVVKPGETALREIEDYFGPEVLTADGKLDRKKMASIVFKDHAARDMLNSIIHPRVIKRIVEKANKLKVNHNPEAVVYDVPLLIEKNMQELVDVLLLVYVTREVQEERLVIRDGFTKDEIEHRLSAQMPLEDKKQYAGYIIDNSKNMEETGRQVDEFWSILPVLNSKKNGQV